jgi:hypothetical protein
MKAKGRKRKPTRAKGRKTVLCKEPKGARRGGFLQLVQDVADLGRDQPYFDISQIRRPGAVFGVLADAIRLLADALRVGRITPEQLAERLLEVEGAVRGRAR